LYTYSQGMEVLSYTVALHYYDCCTVDSTSPRNYGNSSYAIVFLITVNFGLICMLINQVMSRYICYDAQLFRSLIQFYFCTEEIVKSSFTSPSSFLLCLHYVAAAFTKLFLVNIIIGSTQKIQFIRNSIQLKNSNPVNKIVISLLCGWISFSGCKAARCEADHLHPELKSWMMHPYLRSTICIHGVVF
jgi:hypothetical protein